MSITLAAGTITADKDALLTGLPDNAELVADALGVGSFVRFKAEKPAARIVFEAGKFGSFRRFTSLRRYEPFWMIPEAGSSGTVLPVETQFLLIERIDGSVALLVPLIDGKFRCAIQGTAEGAVQLVAESGDISVVTDAVIALFIASGNDPYDLIERAARSVNAFIGNGRLRKDKSVPRFVDQFGWCTWDAFYQDVSADKVRLGLQSFRDGCVEPKVLILDDGWQSERATLAGTRLLTSFAPNAKFGGDLRPTVEMAKNEFGIASFLVWHAMTGYWGGVDAEAMPGYDVRNVARNSSEGIKHYSPTIDTWWGTSLGLVAPEHVYRFFHDYHRLLRSQGVDGVKVDVQAQLESVAQGAGGRVELMRRYHEALEGSVHVHFHGELINCMSCSNDMLYSAPNSTVTRTSTDFWPKKPESHGLHLYTNAQVTNWFGQFVFPDWDMFQSGHPMGSYHAAGRAVGGCPVYVSDKPDEHNFDLLRKIVLPDGGILRCQDVGRPTRDCLFHDPTKENVLLKIFNRNAVGGVVGVFNGRYGGEGTPTAAISGSVSAADVHGLVGETFAIYAHNAKSLSVQNRSGKIDITLPELSWEIFTIMPIVNGIGAIGLLDMLNSGGAVLYAAYAGNVCQLRVRGTGRFGAYCQSKPRVVSVGGKSSQFSYDDKTRLMVVDIPTSADGGATDVFISAGQ